MNEPTPELVRSFWTYMTSHFASVAVQKDSSTEMRVLSTALSALGILDAKTFLTKYATTLGHRIYLPFEPGVANSAWSPWAQMAVCVHEIQHVVQFDLLGPVAYGVRYLTSTSQRARLEADAYRSTLEMYWWHAGTLLDPSALANLLRAYGASDTDVAMARMILEASGESVKQGAVINPSTVAALAWLNQHAPSLRALPKAA